MRQNNLALQLTRVRAGDIDFTEFVMNTRKEFERMAIYLTKRWPSPEWFTTDDVQQELYLGAWNYVWQWDDERGVTIDRYTKFNAMHKAKRALHVARGVTICGKPDFKPSCFEKTVSSIVDGTPFEGDQWMDFMLAANASEPPKAEEFIIDEQERKISIATALKMCETSKERYAVLAIREAGSIDDAWQVLYNDLNHRIALRLDSEESADDFVFRQAWAVAQRVEQHSVKSI